MKISIWGNELPAWTAAAALAESGNQICIVTGDEHHPSEMEFKVSNEPGLQQLIDEELASGRLIVASATNALSHSPYHIFALKPDELDIAESLTKQLATIYSSNLLIINQSNFGLGNSERLQQLLDENHDQVVTYIPDMLAEGSALKNFKHQESLIIGCQNDWAMLTIKAMLRPFTQTAKQWLVMSTKEAEFTKLANTGMLALRLGYINELANLADQLNVDIEVIRSALMSDPRIGPHYLQPGCGFGGLHFQQYLAAFSELMTETRNSKLLDTVLSENEKQKEQPFRKLWRYYSCDLSNKCITIWGLSFKPGTASIDNAPSLKIIETLFAQNCEIKVHDPAALKNIQEHFGHHHNIGCYEDCYEALTGSDGLLVLTEWPEYWSPDYTTMLEKMSHPLLIDGRNIFDKELLKSLGFVYSGVGRQ